MPPPGQQADEPVRAPRTPRIRDTKRRSPDDAEKRRPGRARSEPVALLNRVKAQCRACNHGQCCQQPSDPKTPSACRQGHASNQGWNEHEFQQEEHLEEAAETPYCELKILIVESVT
jgi:hypothetical protein